MPSEIVAVVEAVSTASAVSKPVLVGRSNARLLGPVEVEIERSAATGGGTVYGIGIGGNAQLVVLALLQPADDLGFGHHAQVGAHGQRHDKEKDR
jgi:hypothetical protein